MHIVTKIILLCVLIISSIIASYFIYQEYMEWKTLRIESKETLSRMNTMMDKAEGAVKSGNTIKYIFDKMDTIGKIIE